MLITILQNSDVIEQLNSFFFFWGGRGGGLNLDFLISNTWPLHHSVSTPHVCLQSILLESELQPSLATFSASNRFFIRFSFIYLSHKLCPALLSPIAWCWDCLLRFCVKVDVPCEFWLTLHFAWSPKGVKFD